MCTFARIDQCCTDDSLRSNDILIALNEADNAVSDPDALGHDERAQDAHPEAGAPVSDLMVRLHQAQNVHHSLLHSAG